MEIHFPSPVSEQEISRDTLLEKYAKDGEQSVAQVRRRVARALAQVEREADRAQWERRFLQAQEEGFIPAGRINSAAGVNLQATLINCFVQPVGDSISEVVDGRPGIYTALQEAAETMRRGGGVGYDFSRHPPQGRGGQGHALARERPAFLHARVRPLVRDGRVRRLAPRRADGRAALRPPGHRGLHPRQGQGRPRQLQHLGRRDRRVHGRGGEEPRGRAGAPRQALGQGCAPARRRPVGLQDRARARAVGPDHALDVRPRRAGHPVPRPHQHRQQPAVLREHRGDQSLRRAAAAAVRLLLPRIDRSDEVRAQPISAKTPRSISTASARSSRRRSACSTTCSTSPPGRSSSSARKRWPSAASASASPAWATRSSCCACATTPTRRAPWRRASRRACATTPTSRRPSWRRSAARFRCSTPISICRGPASPRVCPRRSRS